ncbi:T9SS type A sorting domain-containing protein [Pedobacter alpinus]|uniref:T9SS type A sorting domain-containing protein n=1 Tax=Pedobacter alpinus TaxID=1590643 RepID=A0ABW5TSY2_9SPHI
MKKVYFILLFIFFNQLSFSQTLAISTINVGGNTTTIRTHQFDWSIGESCSIASFSNPNNLLVTSGVLQPIYVEKIIANNFGNVWTNDEVSLYPIPTKDFFTVALKTTQKGTINFTLLNLSGIVLETRSVNHIYSDELEKFDLSKLSPGIYYLEVVMAVSPTVFKPKRGTFKIVKI